MTVQYMARKGFLLTVWVYVTFKLDNADGFQALIEMLLYDIKL
jgi:hypothetical protein